MKLKKKLHILFLAMTFVLLFTARVFATEDIDGAPSIHPRNKIVNLNGFRFYYDKNGTMVKKQFVTIQGKTYYFGSNGVMKQNEIFARGSKNYYANAKGVIVKNRFVTIGNKRFFFDKNGVQKTGWITYNKHTYYCPASGRAYRNEWKKIGKYYYYFTSSYYIRKSRWVGKYYVDSNGHRIINSSGKAGKKKTISMSNIKQNPELPTGCESVALTMVLKYYGFSLSKTTIASSYLPKSGSNFVTAFAGNPFSASGAGIYSPGLTNTANKYLKAKKSGLRAYNITGTDFDKLSKYIDQGIPVIVWNTMYMQNPVPVSSMSALGKTWTFYQSEHCVVLCGYDKTKNKVLINDSLSGLVWRNKSSFKSLYNRLGKMAVVIK